MFDISISSTLLQALLTSFIFGFFQDFADLLDEHGLTWFKGSQIAFGLLWATAGVYMIFLYPIMAIFVFALTIFWLIANKLDYFNHQISASILLLSSLYIIQIKDLNVTWAIVLVILHFVSWLISKSYKNKFGSTKLLHLRHFITPLVLSFFVYSIIPSIIHISLMLGVWVSTRLFDSFEKNENSHIYKKMGMSITKQNTV